MNDRVLVSLSLRSSTRSNGRRGSADGEWDFAPKVSKNPKQSVSEVVGPRRGYTAKQRFALDRHSH